VVLYKHLNKSLALGGSHFEKLVGLVAYLAACDTEVSSLDLQIDPSRPIHELGGTEVGV